MQSLIANNIKNSIRLPALGRLGLNQLRPTVFSGIRQLSKTTIARECMLYFLKKKK